MKSIKIKIFVSRNLFIVPSSICIITNENSQICYDSSYPSGFIMGTTGCTISFQMMLASAHEFWSMLWVTVNTAFLMRTCNCWRSWFLTLWTRFFTYLHRKKSNVINLVTLVARQLPLLRWSFRQASCDISQFISRVPGQKTVFSSSKPA